MSYHAPVADIAFTLKYVAGLKPMLDQGLFGDLDEATVDAVLDEAGKMASEVIAPLNRVGDKLGTRFENGTVTMPPGWKDAYTQWWQGGWNGLSGPSSHGGQELPHLVNAACIEMWNSASMAFGIGPVLTMGAAEALGHHGSAELKDRYLEKMVTGEFMGTMNLTEPQSGSDLSTLRAKAEPVGDGSYRVTGQKIYITYGEHDLTANIVHLVLARLPDAPQGTRGISLFLVPKFLPDGSRNDVRCAGVEHKLGIHGSPTCTMVFGDEGGAIGWLIGEENRGLNCMFTMMNNARLAVGLQGVGIAERAYQQAIGYARQRVQGKVGGVAGHPIVGHPDVKRMLLTMRSLTRAARSICYQTAAALDEAECLTDPLARKAAHERASLLTPIAKAFSTDVGIEVASIGVQVHGGMGYVEETGAAQHLRDARIAAIYEGTNGIQAIDLVTRKLPLAGAATVQGYLGSLKETVQKVRQVNAPWFGAMGWRLGEAVQSLDRATSFMLARVEKEPETALAGATPYLKLFGLAAGGCLLAEKALTANRMSDPVNPPIDHMGRIETARFFAENLTTEASGLERAIVEGAESVIASDAALA